jgi:ribosomal protein L37E
MKWTPPQEKDEKTKEKVKCENCGNDTFHVYITIIIDDARLYCAKCGAFAF